ncbi:hypothetical protein [Vagococcus fluvialis]|uniref:hypothetical protein n=1 Tax=Vagococcus fluvialis TaxID=2738 RepID=UPI003B5AFA69
MEKLTKLEEQKKKIDAQIRLERKTLREKNERIIGKNVRKYFRVETWAEVEKQLSTQVSIGQNPVDSETQQLLAELRHIANDMEFNGKFWRVNDLAKLTQTLSRLRDDKGEG